MANKEQRSKEMKKKPKKDAKLKPIIGGHNTHLHNPHHERINTPTYQDESNQ